MKLIKLAIKIGVAAAIGESAYHSVRGVVNGIALGIMDLQKKRKERRKNNESDNNRS